MMIQLNQENIDNNIKHILRGISYKVNNSTYQKAALIYKALDIIKQKCTDTCEVV